jgi:bifunctional DNA-binding transcriptional regulator/antitoxin component of YhaV-PrlF toxin-antitoxin module
MNSKVHYVRKGSPSVKTVIPQGVADALKIKHEDMLEWEIIPDDGTIIARVRKAKKKA